VGTKARTRRKPKAAAEEVDSLFEPVVASFAGDRTVAPARMFGSTALKDGGKVFAMLVKGKLVVKVPADRVAALVAAGRGEHFDPGHGRLMREWVAVGAAGRRGWIDLAREARAFVASHR
jgi:hypothetical protein